MPDWLIALLNKLVDNPLAMGALGTAIVVPVCTVLAAYLTKKAPPARPVAYDARDLPEHPLLVSSKVHLAEEPEWAALHATMRKLEHIHDDVKLVHDRIDLLMRAPSRRD